jgi:hypothetical protein
MKRLDRLFWTILLLLPFTQPQLVDSITISGSPEQIPNLLNQQGFNQLFNLSTRQSVLSKGDKQLFFLRWLSYDGAASISPQQSFTSAFEVRVDDYTQLVIPNSNRN